MTKEKDKNQNEVMQININSVTDLQVNYKQLADQHLSMRFANNPEFKSKFLKTFSDLVFSQNDDMLEMLPKMKQNSLLNSVFKATEAGASFANGEVYLLPFKIFKKVNEKGVEKKVDTGEYNAIVIFDVNFQKQQLLKLDNCKRFFTAEVREGVKVVENLITGSIDFEGTNDVTKPTIGYYACFITTEGERYDKFMTNAEIIERAKFSPHFKADNYKSESSNIHFEKVVIRNLMKEIPKVSEQLKTILSVEELEYADYEIVNDSDAIDIPKVGAKKTNKLEQAKKEISDLPDDYPKTKAKKENVDESTGEVTEDEFF